MTTRFDQKVLKITIIFADRVSQIMTTKRNNITIVSSNYALLLLKFAFLHLIVFGDADNSDVAIFSGGDWARGLKISICLKPFNKGMNG